ncbi:MAG: IS1380 family transposase [Brachymonas sp.]|nr:IS1380 family transposase [Brachymonas sp.]
MGLELAFTDKQITPWGGMALMKNMLERIDWDRAVLAAQLPQPGSNRGYAPEQLVGQFMLSIWCGANRFEHLEATRFDPVIGQVFGYERMANYKAFTRLIDKFDQASIHSVFPSLYQHCFAQVGLQTLTLDLDSTVLTRYGQHQGAQRGYNPSKRGRASHHPLMAFVADSRMLANVWLRPGNSSSANNAISFLQSSLDNVGCNSGHKRVGLLRADSGFCDNAFLSHLEQSKLPYTVAMRLTRPLQHQLVNARWWPLQSEQPVQTEQQSRRAPPAVPASTGIELCELHYQADSWEAPRRIIGVRQHIHTKPDAKGKTLSLFADDEAISGWRYAAIVTDLQLPEVQVWRLYRGRADCENRIKELKYDFALGTLVRRNFWATEAALHFVMLSFNLMSLFRAAMQHQINKTGTTHTLASLRQQLFAQAGFITHEGRKTILKLATAMQRRQWLSGLWDASKSFEKPITAKRIFDPPARL